MASTSSNKNKSEIQIRFISKQERYPMQSYPLLIDISTFPDELNTLLRQLLKDETASSLKFDFLVFGQFLRTSLAEHIAEKNASTEDVIDVEFIEKYSAPKPQDCLLHDDWVSAVAVCDKWILTGSYDNTLKIWTTKGKDQLTISGHISPIKEVAWISVDNDNASFVSVSQDQTAIIWLWDIAKNSVESACICEGHRRSVEAVSVNYDKSLIATGSWDTSVKIWSTSKDDLDEDLEPKKTKLEYNIKKVSKRTMMGHKEAVNGVVWSDKTEIITSSLDHTLKIWDAELGGIKNEIVGHNAFFDLDYSPLARAVVACSADCHIKLYDPRSSEGAIMKAKFTSHTQWVQCVCWSTVDEHLFVSGAYDNILKLWDTRSLRVPLFDLLGHENKVMCCSWSNPALIASGAQDNTLRIYKSKHIACKS